MFVYALRQNTRRMWRQEKKFGMNKMGNELLWMENRLFN